jgi:hypothetical protein
MEMQKHGHDPVLFHDIQVRILSENLSILNMHNVVLVWCYMYSGA